MKKKKSLSTNCGKVIFAIIVLTVVLDGFIIYKSISSNYFKRLKTFDINKTIADNMPLEKNINRSASGLNNIMRENYSGNIYNNNGSLLEKSIPPKDSDLRSTALYINEFHENYSDKPMCVTYVPTAASVYSESLPVSDPSSLMTLSGDYLFNYLDSGIRKADINSSLHSAKDDYIYCRTDTHWTPYGAFCGYRKIIRILGFSPTEYSKYSIEHELTSFRGNLYDKCRYTDINPDYADKFICNGGSSIQSVEKTTVDGQIYPSYDFFAINYLSSNNPLNYYTGKHSNIIKITTNESSGKNLVIIGDDFADEMLIFFVQHYHTITLIRPDGLNVDEFDSTDINSADEILFLCTLETYGNSKNFENLYNCSKKS